MTRRASPTEPRQGLLFTEPAHGASPAAPPRPDNRRAESAPPGLRLESAATPSAGPSAASGDREIHLGAHRIGYALRRVRRQSIGFVVAADGLTVKAPSWVPLRDVESALRVKADWILRKLQEQQDHAHRRRQARIEWRDGTTIPFLGERVLVVVDSRTAVGSGVAVLDADGAPTPDMPRLTLRVTLGPGAQATQLRDSVRSWLQRQARRVFEERCAIYAERLGVRMTRLALSSAQTRWGSASASGAIRLNWRLIHFALPTIDYVVAHELAHLREMNHSARFWDVVRSVLPDYERARRALRSQAVPQLD